MFNNCVSDVHFNLVYVMSHSGPPRFSARTENKAVFIPLAVFILYNGIGTSSVPPYNSFSCLSSFRSFVHGGGIEWYLRPHMDSRCVCSWSFLTWINHLFSLDRGGTQYLRKSNMQTYDVQRL